MQVIMGNNGISYRINDINYFPSAGKTYLYNGQSTPISIGDIYAIVSTLGAPTQSIMALVNDPTTEQIDAINAQYYWLFGDATHGGLAFAKSGNSVVGYRYSTTANRIDSYDNLGNTGNLYIYDIMYVNGSLSDRTSYIIVSPNSSGRLGGSVAEVTVSSVDIYTAYKNLNTMPDNLLNPQGGWSYISISAITPEGIGENQTNTSQVEILGINPFWISKSPWLEYNLPNRDWFDWYSELEKLPKNPFENVEANDDDPGGDGTIVNSVPDSFSPLPPDILSASGIIKMYHPSESDMAALTNWLYSRPDNIITNIKKIWADPFDSIISLAVVPFNVTDSTNASVKFCGIDTGLSFPTISRYMSVDCGFLTLDGVTPAAVPEEYKCFISYGMFTKVKIDLPFIGIVDLNTDDIIGSYVHCKYNIDLLSGNCIAELVCNKNRPEKNINYSNVIYRFNGNVIDMAPLSGTNWSQLYSGIISGLQHVAMATCDPIGGSLGIASDLISPKVNVERSGQVSGNFGALGEFRPKLIIERPPLNNPSGFPFYEGYVSNKTKYIKNCAGFTQTEPGTFRIHNTVITDEEVSMIKNLLEEGIICPDITGNRDEW